MKIVGQLILLVLSLAFVGAENQKTGLECSGNIYICFREYYSYPFDIKVGKKLLHFDKTRDVNITEYIEEQGCYVTVSYEGLSRSFFVKREKNDTYYLFTYSPSIKRLYFVKKKEPLVRW